MKKSKKNQNNSVHIYGYINDVRINTLENGRTAINLDVATIENYKDKEGNSQARKSYHDVAVFTDDKKLIASFKKIAVDTEMNRENRGVEGYKPVPHTISMDGILVNRSAKVGEEKEYQTIQILASKDSIDLDVKQAEGEYRNVSMFAGNIGDIKVYEDKKFATLSVAQHYRPEGSETEHVTWINVRVNGDRKASKEAYEAIVNGTLKKGDFVRMGGQLHNNNYDSEDGTRYGVSVDLTSFKKLEKKEAETVEVKEEAKPAKKAAEKAAPKKATSKKVKKGVTMA